MWKFERIYLNTLIILKIVVFWSARICFTPDTSYGFLIDLDIQLQIIVTFLPPWGSKFIITCSNYKNELKSCPKFMFCWISCWWDVNLLKNNWLCYFFLPILWPQKVYRYSVQRNGSDTCKSFHFWTWNSTVMSWWR